MRKQPRCQDCSRIFLLFARQNEVGVSVFVFFDKDHQIEKVHLIGDDLHRIGIKHIGATRGSDRQNLVTNLIAHGGNFLKAIHTVDQVQTATAVPGH